MSKNRVAIGIAIILILIVSGSALAISLSGGGDLGKQLELGEKYLSEGKYEEAILAFEKAIKIDEKNIGARIGLAKAYVATDNLEKAEEVLQDAIGIDPARPEPYIELANVYILEGKTDEAINILKIGYENTKDENIKKLLGELTANPEGALATINQDIKPTEKPRAQTNEVRKEIVTFEDKEFEKYVREKIKKDTGDIYSTDLISIRFIRINTESRSSIEEEDLMIGRINIESVNDLKHFQNLYGLEIADLRVDLKDLRLNELKRIRTLILKNTQTNDIYPLNGLENLGYLAISDCPISDISVLKTLNNLYGLRLIDLRVKDISALAELRNLKTLSLGNNQISDISPLKGLVNLESLYLGNNQISDISPLKELVNLEDLNIMYNPIRNFDSLDGLSKLDHTSIDIINEMKQGEYLGKEGE